MRRLISIFFIAFFLTACGVDPAHYEYPTKDGWKTSTPEAQGMDSAVLAKMVQGLNQRQTNYLNSIHSILVIRHGVLVAEVYFAPYTKDTLHQLASCTKSVQSMIFGIGVRDGWIKGEGEKLCELLPGYADIWQNEEKRSISLGNTLTMTSGLKWNDETDMAGFIQAKDPVRFVLAQPLAAPPGKLFNYTTGMNQVLSAAIKSRSGKTFEEAAREYIFEPLGIGRYDWWRLPSGEAGGGLGLMLTPRDQAKLGYLYLRNGKWEDRVIIPEEWVKKSLIAYAPCWDHYMGFFWRVDPKRKSFYAAGYGGQTILFCPDLDLVLVVNATTYEEPFEMFKDFIFPAVISTEALPENPSAYQGLGEAAAMAQHPAGRKTEMSNKIFDIAVNVEENAIGLEWFKMTLGDENTAELELRLRISRDKTIQGKYLVGMDGRYRENKDSMMLSFLGGSKPNTLIRAKWVDEKTILMEMHNVGEPVRNQYLVQIDGNLAVIRRTYFPGRTTTELKGTRADNATVE